MGSISQSETVIVSNQQQQQHILNTSSNSAAAAASSRMRTASFEMGTGHSGETTNVHYVLNWCYNEMSMICFVRLWNHQASKTDTEDISLKDPCASSGIWYYNFKIHLGLTVIKPNMLGRSHLPHGQRIHFIEYCYKFQNIVPTTPYQT